MALTDRLKAIADALREKTGDTAEMTLDEIAAGIQGLTVGSGVPSVITAGDTPVMASTTGYANKTTTVTASGCKVMITTSGTYRFYAFATAIQATGTIYLYQNGESVAEQSVAVSGANQYAFDVTCAAGDEIEIYAAAGTSSYLTAYCIVLGMIACVEWDNGF